MVTLFGLQTSVLRSDQSLVEVTCVSLVCSVVPGMAWGVPGTWWHLGGTINLDTEGSTPHEC